MKICSISDIHGELIDIPKCDVLCICGDIVGLNDQRSMDASRYWWYNRFTSWINRQPCDKVIITPGNHDFFIEHAYKNDYLSELKLDLSVRTNGKLVILINDDYIYRETKFYGCPFIRPIFFQEDRWAFRDNYSGTNNDCCYDSIPADTDVLLTHDNPYNNEVLDYYIPKGIPYHFYGHWHNGFSEEAKGRYNCSIRDDNYNCKKKFKPITIEIMAKFNITEIKKEYLKDLTMYFEVFCKLQGIEGTEYDKVKTFFTIQKEVLDLPFIEKEDETPLPVTGEEFEPECVNYEDEENED